MSNHAPVPFETTLHVRDHCLCLAAQRAARSLARRFDEALKPAGITSGQFSLLMSLNRPEPPPMGAVASLLAMDRTTLTANLKPLERRGLVELLTDIRDRRSRRIRLTDAGMSTLNAAMPIWVGTHAEIDERLGDTEVSALRAGLRAVA
ncbi:MarR family winged helix-turn-helix transcriptional regulator [Rhizobium sp. LjRoot254]|uniref:MarR family winged helix-turn-helix transcriptional regulator n=1 Tax=Rhizobium sp. LjRoot254 TaxID=3342297 RepID=UPI003ECF55F5